MKSIEERMAVLLNPELDEAVLTEQMLFEAVSSADTILEANGLKLSAGDLNSYIDGLQDILENYELSEEDHAELQEIWRALVRGAGHVARGVGRTVGTVKKAKAAVGRAIGHVAGSYGAGHEAGVASRAGPDEFEAPPKKEKDPNAPKKLSLWQRATAGVRSAAAAGAAKEKERIANSPAGKSHAEKSAALKAKQDADKAKAAEKSAEAPAT